MFISSVKRINKYRKEIEVLYKYVAEIDMLMMSYTIESPARNARSEMVENR